MSDSAGWRWIGRVADVAGVLAGVVAPLALAVVAVTKKRQLTQAVGADIAVLGAIGVLALVGLVLFVGGVRRRVDAMGAFAADRGRGETVAMFSGSTLLVAALLGLLLV